MLFNSLEFCFFFPIVTLLYFLLPYKLRWLHLLIASCIFYMFFVPIYILILIFTIVIDYGAGILIEKAKGKRRKLFLICSIIANVGVLAFFKYYNFFTENLDLTLNALHIGYALPYLRILLPIGLSFHTFQAMSYTIEVYRGRQKAERHFGIYALYVMFYPQLVAGPIERPQNLIHQFYEKFDFDAERVSNGLKLMLWGLFKKIVIADRLAVYVDAVYARPQYWDGVNAAVASIFFAYQIYCDFSAYSDIAIGAAQVMGFKLMTNFNRPSHARTIAEFWKRWHISLTTWLRDYIFIPLSRRWSSRGMREFNLFITFLIVGIWHGANWTFVAYGAISGFYILFSNHTANFRRKFVQKIGLSNYPKLHHVVKIVITFLLMCFAGIFFRSNSMTDAVYLIKAMIKGIVFPMQRAVLQPPVSSTEILICVGLIIFLEFMQTVQGKRTIPEMIAEKPTWARWTIYYALIMTIIFLGEFNSRQFIYFQF